MSLGGISRRALIWASGGALVAGALPAQPAAAGKDPFQELAEDHRRILALLERIEGTDDAATNERVKLLGELRREIARHAAVEEYVFYPALRQNPENARRARDLAAEHSDVKTLLYDLDLMPRSDVRWIQKARDLHRLLETHMRREEEDVFPKHRASLNDSQLEFLSQLAQRERDAA